MDTETFLGALGAFTVAILTAQWRLVRAMQSHTAALLRAADTRAAADRASSERAQGVLVAVLRDHLAEAVGAISDARRRLSDVHDAVLSSPCRANGAGPGHVREG